MSGYLEEYGAGEEQRENLIRNSIIIAVVVIAVTAVAYYLFRPFHQVRVTKHFLGLVKAKDYPAAYADWGCTTDNPCKEYAYSKFLEDWGPKSPSDTHPFSKSRTRRTAGRA